MSRAVATPCIRSFLGQFGLDSSQLLEKTGASTRGKRPGRSTYLAPVTLPHSTGSSSSPVLSQLSSSCTHLQDITTARLSCGPQQLLKLSRNNLPLMHPVSQLLCSKHTPPLFPILSQFNPVHTLTTYSFATNAETTQISSLF